MVATTYTRELAALICDAIASGVTFRALEDVEGMPNRSTVWAWCKRYPEFKRSLTEAREEAAHAYADEAVYIADTEKDAQRARVMVDVRKWLAGCIRPQSYGPKLELHHVETVDPAELHRQGMARARIMRDGTSAYLIPQIVEGEKVLVPASTIFD